MVSLWEFDERPSESAEAIRQWRALVDQHEVLASDDTQAAMWHQLGTDTGAAR